MVRCAPPDNRPTSAETAACRSFLLQELALLPKVRIVLALGKIAFDGYLQALRAQGKDPGRPKFAHGQLYRFDDPTLPMLLCSYHPSRQNTNTGKLTREMWHAVFSTARQLIGE